MRIVRTAVAGIAAVAALCGATAWMTGSPAAAAGRWDRRIVIDCAPGWRGGAGGVYGGVAFDVSCNNGRGQTTIAGTSGTAYSIRMGVESSTGALDCAFTGDSPAVSESCGVVGLTIE